MSTADEPFDSRSIRDVLALWFGVLAPAGTPKPILDKVSQDIAKVLQMPDVSEKLIKQGSIPTWNTPDQFNAINKADTERYSKILHDAGVTPQ